MPGFAELKVQRSIADLQLLAGLVWARECGVGSCPVVRPSHKRDYSEYFYGSRAIALAPEHRCVGGLLHELAHALGINDKLTHGPAFRKRCLRLYKTYSAWNGEVE